jgi:hypothetical protein
MEGVLGPLAARLDANVRIVRGTAFVPGTVNTSSQADYYVALPAAANGVFAGVAAEDFFETGYTYTAGTDPSTVNGTTPAAPYNLSGKRVAIVRRGRFPMLAAGAIADRAFVKIADTSGRVTAVGGEAAGTIVNVVGQAMHPASAVNDYVFVDIAPFVYKA